MTARFLGIVAGTLLGVSSLAVAQSVPKSFSAPASFVENRGQWDTPAHFIARRDGGWVRAESGRLVLQREDAESHQGVVVALAFDGAQTRAIEGVQKTATTFNYFLGDDSSRWQTEVPGFEAIVYRDLYPGIDMVVRDASGVLEYDFVLAPGADLSQVRVRYEGIESLRVLGDERLVVETVLGPLEQKIPAAWTEGSGGDRAPVECHYRRLGEWSVGFWAPSVDQRQRLVIDPSLEWSSVIGGTDRDEILDIALTSAGRIFATGFSDSTDFPANPGAYDGTLNGQTDVVVLQISPSGTTLFAATYIGGSDNEQGNAIDVTDSGVVTVGGLTDSSNFPTTPGAWDTTFSSRDGFVLNLNGTGTTLNWSTFLGGSGADFVQDLAVTQSGDVFLCGGTSSTNFPTIAGAYDTSYNGGYDCFVTRMTSNGAGLPYSTFVGGSETEWAFALALDPTTLAVTVTGFTESLNFPRTGGAFQPSHQGGRDAFMFRMLGGSTLQASTFLGGSLGDDTGTDITIDSFGNATIIGSTSSSNFPTTGGAYDATYNGGTDLFVTNVNAAATGLFYSTFLGGSGDDYAGGLYSPSNLTTLYIAGETTSADFPVTPGAFKTSFGGREVFALRMTGNAALLQYSTFLGQGGATEIEVDSFGDVVVGGWAGSAFVTTPGSFDSTHNGGRDGFLTKLRLGPIIELKGRAVPGNPLHYEMTGAPSTETGFRAQVLSSCSGSTGIPLPNSGGLVLPLTFDICTQLSLNIAVLLQGIIQSDGTATTPNLAWPNVNPGIVITSAAYTLDLVNLQFSSVTPPIQFVSL
ncbi:MAG: SBBP repeat-containing protein [Planctomycetota bacterium]